MSDHVEHHIAELYEQISHLRGIVERTHRMGKVTDVDYSDPKKPRFRMEHGVDEDGQPVKGPWQPHTQHAGDRAIHTPLTIGQTMLSISPDGNFENAVAIPYGPSQNYQAPSTSTTDHVDKLGSVTTTLTKTNHVRQVGNHTITHDANGIHLNCDGTTFSFSQGGLAVQGGALTHDGLHFDANHVHKGVQPGGGDTGPPAS